MFEAIFAGAVEGGVVEVFGHLDGTHAGGGRGHGNGEGCSRGSSGAKPIWEGSVNQLWPPASLCLLEAHTLLVTLGALP